MQWGLVQNKSKELSALRRSKSLGKAAETAVIANPTPPAKEGIEAQRNLEADLNAAVPTEASSDPSGGNGSPSFPAQTGPGLKAAVPAVASSDTNDDKGSASSPEKASLDLRVAIDSVKDALLQPKAAREAAPQ